MDIGLFWNGLWWGVVGTFAMSILMMLGKISGMSPMPKPIPLAVVDKVVGEERTKALRMGLAIMSHFFYGGLWGVIFVYLLGDPFIWNGLILGAVIWLIMQVMFLPFLDWGPFGKKISLMVPLITLMMHLVYGGALGWMAAENPVL